MGIGLRLATLFCAGLTSMLALAAPPAVPRPAPEFAFAGPDAKPATFASYKGKVVIVEFLYTTCSHCQHAAQMLSKMQAEYGSRGLQVVGVAWNPMAHMLAADFVRDYKATFPVGSSERDAVCQFLGFDPNYRISVPQYALIDRRGWIVEQTPEAGDAKWTDEKTLRATIERLLATK